MKITIAHISGRVDPKWEWFVDSLANQTTPEQRANLHLVFVDGKLWNCPEPDRLFSENNEINLIDLRLHDLARRDRLAQIIAGRFPYAHIPPKPCAWQGPFRQTKVDWFCASNARNTAIIATAGDFLACVDDLSVLNDIWFAQVMHAAEHGYVVCGAYQKQKKLLVVNGVIEAFEDNPNGRDSRMASGSTKGIVPWHGKGLFGCSFGLPIEAALEVDGFDGTGNGQGFEDCDFGARLENAGWALHYNINMLSVESDEDHFNGETMKRESKEMPPDRLPAGYNGNPMSDHVMLYRMNQPDTVQPLIGEGLRAMRERFLATGLVPLPTPNQTDWRDGRLLKDL